MANYISGNSIRSGHVIVYNKDLYRVMKAEHRTPGNKRAFMQAKLRSLKDGTQTEVKFRADEEIERATLEQSEMEFLYEDATSGYCFMNSQTYEQIFIEAETMGDVKLYLLPNSRVTVEFHDDRPIGVQPPETVELKVVDTEPQLRGATVSGSGKPATLETGLVVTVPQFVNIGEVIRVSTSTGAYQERAKG